MRRINIGLTGVLLVLAWTQLGLAWSDGDAPSVERCQLAFGIALVSLATVALTEPRKEVADVE